MGMHFPDTVAPYVLSRIHADTGGTGDARENVRGNGRAGPRRRASCPSVYSYPSQLEHFTAAEVLCHRMHWAGELRAGALRGGFVFVWAGASDPVEFRNAYTVERRG